MKHDKFLLLVGTVALILPLYNAKAGQVSCKPGCFCLLNGQYDNSVYYEGNASKNIPGIKADEFFGRECGGSAQSIPASYSIGSDLLFYDGGTISTSHEVSMANYYVDEFSALWEGSLGFYGIIGGDTVHMPYFRSYQSVYQCPNSYPSSEAGAKSLYECFKYNEKGKKVYYGSGVSVTCEEGFYLPANATQCKVCEPSKNQVCPGGKFEVSDIKDQGLKIICNPNQYLPSNAAQCKACDDRYYLCYGGIFNAGIAENQGIIKHNGYINTVNKSSGTVHKTVTCEPGYYLPAKSSRCQICSGDYVCPGGVFYTDVTYNIDRGTVLCGYGYPNDNHTECKMVSSKPSYMKKKAETPTETNQKTELKRDTKISYTESKKNAKVADFDMMVTPSVNRSAVRSAISKPQTVVRARSVVVTQNKETSSRKPNVHRAAKTTARTSNVINAEIIRDTVKLGRPSKYKERNPK